MLKINLGRIKLAILLLFLFSCGQKSQPKKQSLQLNDTAVHIPNLKSISGIEHSYAIRSIFDSLFNCFSSNTSLFVQEQTTISDSLASRIFTLEEFDPSNEFFINVKPRLYFKNSYGYFFLLQVDCSAGGACSIFYIVAFNVEMTKKRVLEVGKEEGDYEGLTKFEFNLNSDSTIFFAREAVYKDPDRPAIDSMVNSVRLYEFFY